MDRFPQDHPQPPAAVAHKPPGGAPPCAECHLCNGEWVLGAADLNGLPAAYTIEQVNAFRSGERHPAETDRVQVS